MSVYNAIYDYSDDELSLHYYDLRVLNLEQSYEKLHHQSEQEYGCRNPIRL